MGPTINFNVGNEVFDYFADPANDNGAGVGYSYEGDYEFGIVSATPELVILRGKKTNNVMRMTPLPDDTTWEEYLDSVEKVGQESMSPEYKCNFGPDNLICARNGRVLTFRAGAGDDNPVEAPFIYTPTGIRFYEPVTLAGLTMQDFAFDESTETFSSVDTEATLELFFPPVNEQFANTFAQWSFTALSPSLSQLWMKADESLFAAEGENIRFAYIGYNSTPDKFKGRGIAFACSNGREIYIAGYQLEFKPVGGSEELCDIEYADREFMDGKFYSPAFMPIVEFICDNAPYSLSAGDPRDVTEITFTSETDSGVWFTVEI
jgi:hypothetical protein